MLDGDEYDHEYDHEYAGGGPDDEPGQDRTYPDPRFDVSTDPAVVRVLREILERDAVGDGHEIRAEVAREILAGRMRASEVLSVSVYADTVAEGLHEYVEWRDGLSDVERAEREQAAEEYLAAVRAEES